jgi:2-amino-4-hydroxy-6-hydroxymethyldihydropteridine diphosphokinase
VIEQRVFIAIGSNLGDRVENCRRAVDLVTSDKGSVTLIRSSSFYETEPWGVAGQGPFINSVIEVRTGLSPVALLGFLKSVELEMGRTTQPVRWGPRLIDLDIIFYGDKVVKDEGLVVPHPYAHERAFVLVPLSEIAPDFVHPLLGKKVSELVEALPEKKGVKRLKGHT